MKTDKKEMTIIKKIVDINDAVAMFCLEVDYLGALACEEVFINYLDEVKESKYIDKQVFAAFSGMMQAFESQIMNLPEDERYKVNKIITRLSNKIEELGDFADFMERYI